MRLTPAALAKLARTASNTARASLTIASHRETGERYACWSHGCLALPLDLIEGLPFSADGSYTIGTSGGLTALTTTDVPGFSPQLAIDQMLPLLDAGDRAQVEETRWLNEDGKLLRRYLKPAERHPIAVSNDHWQAWAKHTDLPAWHTTARGGLILWALDETSRATALLGTIHPRFTPDIPEWTQDQ